MRRNEVFCAKRPVKDCVTVLLGASMDGFKLKPLVIGKSALPRALIGCNLNALSVHYYNQKHAWMTTKITEHWFYFHLKEEIKDHYGDRKVILTLDSEGPHPFDLGLCSEQIQVRFLPPNTSPIIQVIHEHILWEDD